MSYFYKYTTIRNDFFRNLMLRATQFSALNDPFEGQFTLKQNENIHKNIDNFYKERGIQQFHRNTTFLEEAHQFTQDDLNDIGVFSFTENYSNDLMWAHYADQHKGIVIEFDANQPLFQDSIHMFKDKLCRFKTNSLGDTYEFPEKVIYQKEMHTFEDYKLVEPNSFSEYPAKKYLYTLYYTKSDCWSYEKELRSIVPLRYADSIICPKEQIVRDYILDYPEIEYKEFSNDEIQITFPNLYEINYDMGDESVKDELSYLLFNSKKSNIYLYRINPNAISGIYCGCKCDYSYVQSLIENNTCLNHIKDRFYKMEIASDNYSLIKKTIIF